MKFSGVTILQGVEFSIFPIDFEWALQQCSATALPVMCSGGTLYVKQFLIGFTKISQVTLVVAGGSGPPDSTGQLRPQLSVTDVTLFY